MNVAIHGFARRSIALAILLSGTSLLPAMAGAQTAARDTDANTDIVVTALKRDTRIQETPMSITAVTGENLQRIGASSFSDFYRFVPSMQVTEMSAGLKRITLRGVQAAGEATVGLYYDETPLTGPSGTTSDPSLQTPDINLFDIERVEVLKGPQGTLYGAGSVGGTLRVIFAKPDATKTEVHGEVQGSFTREGDPSYHAKIAFNTPLVQDRLAARLVLYREVRGGFVDNVRYGVKNVNESAMYGGRLMLRFTPNDTIKLTGTALYQKTHIDDNNIWYPQLGEKDYNTSAATRTPLEDRLQLYNLTLNWELPFAELTATGSYYEWDVDRIVDGTPGIAASLANPAVSAARCPAFAGQSAACDPVQLSAYLAYGNNALPYANPGFLTVQTETYEVRMSSKGDRTFNWTVGAFYEKREDFTRSVTGGVNPASGLGPLRVFGVRVVGNNVKQTALFGEVAVKPFDGFTFTAGARRYNYDKEVFGQVLQSNFIIASIAGPRTAVKADASGWVTKLNAAYQVDPSLLVYAQAARGFRPGGANNIPILSAGLVSYKPDRLWNYEIGVKKSWDGGRNTINLAAFRIDWKDLQAQVLLPPAFAILTNVGAARIDGIELEASVRPFQGFSLAGGLGYTDAKLSADQSNASIPATGGTARDGDRIPYVPRYTASVSGQYEWDLTSSLRALVRADMNYRSNSFSEFRPTSATIEKLHPYAVVNARFGIERDEWGAYLFVNNLFDRAGELRVQSQAQQTAEYIFERQTVTVTPRTIGINLTGRF